MEDCCRRAVAEFAQKVADTFGPMTETKDPDTAMTEEQFGIFKVIVYMGELLAEMDEKTPPAA